MQGGLLADTGSELLASAEAWGIPPEALPDDDQDNGVWPENEDAVRAFLAVAGQWRTGAAAMGGVLWLGLDYAAVRAGFALARIRMTPELWDQVRLVEVGARDALNGAGDDA